MWKGEGDEENEEEEKKRLVTIGKWKMQEHNWWLKYVYFSYEQKYIYIYIYLSFKKRRTSQDYPNLTQIIKGLPNEW